MEWLRSLRAEILWLVGSWFMSSGSETHRKANTDDGDAHPDGQRRKLADGRRAGEGRSRRRDSGKQACPTRTNDRDAGVPTEEGNGRDHDGEISNGSPIVDAEQ